MTGPTMDNAALNAVVEAIPPGRWMSYGDVVRAAGGAPRQAIGVNGRLTRLGCAGAHRVLRSDGTVAVDRARRSRAGAALLREEGLAFDGGRADAEARLAPRSPRGPGSAGAALSQRGLELGLELALRVGADDLLGHGAVLEQDQRRDAQDLEGGGGLLVLVDVQLDDLQVGTLGGDLLEDRGDDAARTAPRAPRSRPARAGQTR